MEYDKKKKKKELGKTNPQLFAEDMLLYTGKLRITKGVYLARLLGKVNTEKSVAFPCYG